MPTVSNVVFRPLRIAVLTVSDTRTQSNDRSGDALAQSIISSGHILAMREITRDEISSIHAVLQQWISASDVEVIISVGGTGITGRDVTPEAFRTVLEKELPGFGELFRSLSYAKIGTAAMLSRALGGVSKGKLLFALPGSPNAVIQAWDEILVHQLDNRTLPGNLSVLMPRLQEE